MITDAQWRQYEQDRYLRLGRGLNDEDLAALRQRIDDIMLGTAPVNYDTMLMQLDSETGRYEDSPEQTRGHKGATLNYRKIQDLENDPLFLAYMQRPIFRAICDRTHGAGTPISSFRAMFMNKPARRGTLLPWHQDRWDYLNHDPQITVWTALDPATIGNGCVQIIPGSHRLGLINPNHPSGFLTEDQARQHCKQEKVEYLELEAGEVALLHNWLLHRSDANKTDIPRRAFSVCYMTADTRTNNGESFPVVFGPGAMVPGRLTSAPAMSK